MRQRSLSSSKSIGRGAAFRLALTLSIVGASTAAAQSGLPAISPMSQGIGNSEVSSIAYPFETKREAEARAQAKLVSVLGLRSARPTADVESPASVLPPAYHGPTEPSRVVMAAATDAEPMPSLTAASPSACVDLVPAIALEAPSADGTDSLGSCKVKFQDSSDSPENCSASTAGKAHDVEQDDSLANGTSLLHIDFSAGEQPVAPSAIVNRQPQPVVADGSTPLSARAKKLETNSDRQPTLVTPSRSMSLKIEAPQLKNAVAKTPVSTRRDQASAPVNAVSAASTEMSFSDSDRSQSESTFSFSDFDQESEESANRPVELHLSSASPQRMELVAPRPMQVQVEGEAAVVLALPPSFSEAAGRMTPAVESKSFVQEAASVSSPQKVRASLTALARSEAANSPASELHAEAQASDMAAAKTSEMNVGPAVSVKIQDATAIILRSQIVELSVEHPGICQLIQTGSTTFSLIGLRAGETRVALVTVLPNGQRSIEIRTVTVAGNATETRAGLKGLAEEMTRTIRRIYPNSDVDVLAIDGELLVQGVADNESEARRILGFVRKTSLTPVVDKLRSHDN